MPCRERAEGAAVTARRGRGHDSRDGRHAQAPGLLDGLITVVVVFSHDLLNSGSDLGAAVEE